MAVYRKLTEPTPTPVTPALPLQIPTRPRLQYLTERSSPYYLRTKTQQGKGKKRERKDIEEGEI